MSTRPVIGVLAPPRYPAKVRNTDLWQGVALRRLGEFSQTPVEVRGIEGLTSPYAVLAPHAAARVLGALADRTGSEAMGHLRDRLGLALVGPRAFQGVASVIGHGLRPVSIPGVKLPPLLWGPGLLPDDFFFAAGHTPQERDWELTLKREIGGKVGGIFVTSDISVQLWNERIGVPAPSRIFRVPYFVPALPRSTHPPVTPAPPDRELRILFVGTQSRRKNLPRVIEACRLLSARATQPISLTIVSDFRDGFVDISAPFIRSLGPRPNEEVLALMRSSHVMCVPSRFESFGIVFVEGLARGCAVLAPDMQMQRSLFGDAVLYADPTRPEAIADALERAMDPAVRADLVARGDALYRERYAPDVVATAMVDAALAIA
jgi:glycosyltransferase involved in cell wall biosynthesis